MGEAQGKQALGLPGRSHSRGAYRLCHGCRIGAAMLHLAHHCNGQITSKRFPDVGRVVGTQLTKEAQVHVADALTFLGRF